MNIELPLGIKISLRGDESIALDSLKDTFELLESPHLCDGIALNVYELAENRTLKGLPKWVQGPFYREVLKPVDSGVRFYNTSDRNMFSILSTDCNCFCSWYSADIKQLGYAIWSSSHEKGPLVVQPLVTPLLRELFLGKEGTMLHSGGLCCLEKIGVMIVGLSGSGKTTTTMAMVRTGAKLLGDDLNVLHNESGKIQISGITERLNVSKNILSFFDELAHIQKRFDNLKNKSSSAKISINPHDLFGHGCTVKTCPMRIIYFPQISDEGPIVKPWTCCLNVTSLRTTSKLAEILLPNCGKLFHSLKCIEYIQGLILPF